MAVTVSLIGVAMREENNKEEGDYTHVRIYNGADHTFSVQLLSYFVNCVASDCRIYDGLMKPYVFSKEGSVSRAWILRLDRLDIKTNFISSFRMRSRLNRTTSFCINSTKMTSFHECCTLVVQKML